MGHTFVVEHAPDLTIPEDTILRARLVELAFDTVNYKDKKTGEDKSFDKLTWWFEIVTDNQYRGRKVKAETRPELTDLPGNKFRQWAEILLAKDLAVGIGFNTDELVGLSCDITVRHEADRTDPSKKYERVDELLPAGPGGYDANNPPF